MRKILIILSFVLGISSCAKPSQLELKSPNGEFKIVLDNKGKNLKYNLFKKGISMILDSEISILQGLKVNILGSKIKQVNETWKPVWGQFSQIKDHYNELEVALDYEGTPAKLYARIYNNGVAFRFTIDEVSKNQTPSMFMEYGVPISSNLYASASVKEAFGPVAIGELSKKVIEKNDLKMPLLLENGSDNYISLLESDLISAAGFEVIKFSFDANRNKLVSKNDFVSEEKKLVTPWRIILFEDKIGDFLTNTVPLNVAAPSKIENTSWIKPGKTLWDFRVHGYTAKDGFKYGINNESYYRFIDFAAANGIEYFMIDDFWYTDVKPGYIEMSDKLDLDKVSKYAKEKGVELLLYYDRRKGEYGDEALFPYYNSLEMKGIKYGFMGEKVPFTRDAIRMSAANNLLIDFHDSPVPLTGVSRTYPNAITREYCHAQQDARKAFIPQAFIRMALINGIQGPNDMNNGIFDISGVNAGKRERGPKELNSLLTTVTAEAARTLIVFSGLVCIPDAPEAYEAKQDLFEFIKKMPVGKWDESIILDAKMDSYISTARRHGEEWFIGSVHNEGGALDIPLNFLKENKEYTVTYYEDTDQTDSKTNPEAYKVRTATAKKSDIVKAKMAAAGGHCMWIRPIK